MRELTAPFVRLWDWITAVGGFPGQIIFCSALVCMFLALAVWFGNKRGG